MTAGEIDLLEKYIDLKIKRALAASYVAVNEELTNNPQQIIALLAPIETQLEVVKQTLIKL